MEQQKQLMTVSQKMDEILELAASSETTELVPRQPAEVTSSGNPDKDMQDDFKVARSTLHNLIEKGNELVDNANFFAKETQNARSVEAASMALKEARETATALVNMHKTRKDIERVSTASPGGSGDSYTQTNAVYFGTTGDLLKLTKEMNADGPLKKALRVIDAEPEKKALNIGEEE